MAFVNEKIPQTVLDSFDFSIFEGFYGGTKLPRKLDSSYVWTRDDSKNAFLINTGGYGPRDGYPRADKFALWWNGETVYFGGERVYTRDDHCQVLTWDKAYINIPDHLASRRAEFVALVKEAVVAEGTRNYPAHPENSTKVVIELA